MKAHKEKFLTSKKYLKKKEKKNLFFILTEFFKNIDFA